MGFAIIRIAKVKSTGIAGAQIHNLRLTEKHQNQDIDVSKSHLNQVLAGDSKNFAKEVAKQVEEVQKNQTRKIRKDAPRALEYLVTASPESLDKMNADERRRYFEQSLRFIQDRHGMEHVVSAVVHLDESTPHMHVIAVPIDKDGKLNVKPFTNRTALQQLQTDFAKQVGEGFGLERGKSFEETGERRAHKSLRDFKREQALLEREGREVSIEVPAKKLLESHEKYVERVQAENESLTLAFKALQAEQKQAEEARKRSEQVTREAVAQSKNAKEQAFKLAKITQALQKKLEELAKRWAEVVKTAPEIAWKIARKSALERLNNEKYRKRQAKQAILQREKSSWRDVHLADDPTAQMLLKAGFDANEVRQRLQESERRADTLEQQGVRNERQSKTRARSGRSR